MFLFPPECADYGQHLRGRELDLTVESGADASLLLDPGSCQETCEEGTNGECQAWSFDVAARACTLIG